MNPNNITIDTASVKVMRSYDYCHFEVTLSATIGSCDAVKVDQLRKTAARLADKAVEQYKVAKRAAELREKGEWTSKIHQKRVEAIAAKPESEWTPEERALLKEVGDASFRANRRYDYEDDWDDDWKDDD